MPDNFYEDFYVLLPMEPQRDNDLKESPPRVSDEKFDDHPMWLGVMDVLVRALQPFAEAREAVLRGLDELFAGSSA